MFQYALHILVLWTCTRILGRVSMWGMYQLYSVHVPPYSGCTTILCSSILCIFNALSFLQEEALPNLTSLCNIKICKETPRFAPYSKTNTDWVTYRLWHRQRKPTDGCRCGINAKLVPNGNARASFCHEMFYSS